METKINVRGRLNALEVNQTISLPRSQCKPSKVRQTASILTSDDGKVFSVSAKAGEAVITVTRQK